MNIRALIYQYFIFNAERKLKKKVPSQSLQNMDKSKRSKRKHVEKNKQVMSDEGDQAVSHLPVLKRQKKEKIQNKFQVLLVRTSPKPLFDVMQKLSEKQKLCIEKMGFGQLLNIKMDGIPGRMAYAVLDSFDPKAMELKFGDKRIKVTRESIHQMLGLPMGKIDFLTCNRAKDEDQFVQSWRQQFGSKSIRPNDIKQKIIETDDADFNFKLNFLTLMFNTLGECHLSGKCSLKIVNSIQPTTDISDINWCGHIFNCLKECKDKLQKEINKTFFAGPIACLIVRC